MITVYYAIVFKIVINNLLETERNHFNDLINKIFTDYIAFIKEFYDCLNMLVGDFPSICNELMEIKVFRQ